MERFPTLQCCLPKNKPAFGAGSQRFCSVSPKKATRICADSRNFRRLPHGENAVQWLHIEKRQGVIELTSEIASADLLAKATVAGPEVEIAYQLFHTTAGYGLSAWIIGDPADKVRIEQLTEDPAAAKRIFSLLSENMVFPHNIYEVLDDLLAVDPLT